MIRHLASPVENRSTRLHESVIVTTMSNLINDGLPFLTSQAADLGLTPRVLCRLVEDHRLRRVLHTVYVDASVCDTRLLRAMALELVRPPHAVFCGHTVSFLLGVDTQRPRDRYDLVPQCVVPHGSSRVRRANVTCHEGVLSPSDVMVVAGVPVTTPVRTTSDLLRTMYRPHALAAGDTMAHAQLVDVHAVREYVETLVGFPGVVQARELAHLIEARTESKGESWQRLRLIDAGFPRPEPQIVVTNRSGREIARLDMGYRELQVGAEYDGVFDHTEDADVLHDLERRRVVRELAGWRIAVAGKDQIWGQDNRFELEIGEWIGFEPRPRGW